VIHSLAQRAFISLVKAAVWPSPYRHDAKSGSPRSVARNTSAVGLGFVEL
jgi:hypothetical protein